MAKAARFVKLCEVCDQSHPAVKMCPACQESMCENAAKVHVKQKATLGHELVPVVQSKADPIDKLPAQDQPFKAQGDRAEAGPAVCSQHNQPYGFFDVRCSRAVCRDCMVLEHQGHQCVSLHEGRNRMVRKLEQIQAHADVALRAARDDDAAQRTKLARMEFLFHQKEVDLKLSFNKVRSVSCLVFSCVFVCLGRSLYGNTKKKSYFFASLPRPPAGPVDFFCFFLFFF